MKDNRYVRVNPNWTISHAETPAAWSLQQIVETAQAVVDHSPDGSVVRISCRPVGIS